jgi:SPASM domain peptide maturase of grasp-with-spasm system
MKYRVFANCKLTIGVSRSTLVDLQRERYVFLPNSVAKLFRREIIDLENCKSIFDSQDFSELKSYVKYLEKEKYIFKIKDEEIDFFPPISHHFDFAGEISNCILEIAESNIIQIAKTNVIRELISFGCRNLELRIPNGINYYLLKEIISLKNKYIREFESIDILIFSKNINLDFNQFNKLASLNRNIRTILIFNNNESRIIREKNRGYGGIALVKGTLDPEKCGAISPLYFNMNIKTFTEGLKFNTCLNKKISIDRFGEIKKCPSSKKSFGNIQNSKIEDVIFLNEFSFYNNITKAQIKICRNCEFRNFCTDCRIFISDENDIFSKPLKCSYNPKKMTWES